MSVTTQQPAIQLPAVQAKSEIEYVPFGGEDRIKLSLTIIKNYIAVPTREKELPDERDCMKFMMLCRARRLNPFEGDAFMIGFRKRDAEKAEWSLITSISAFYKRAELHPEYSGIRSGVIVRDGADNIIEREGDFTFEDDKILGGWATVHFRSRSIPMTRKVKLSTYQKPFGVWVTDPGGMICKVAECFDEQTEVLTTRGFEKFSKAEGAVLQVTPNGLEPTNSIPFSQDYSGPMVTFSNHSLDFCVTPNHNMVTDRGFVKAQQLFELSTSRNIFRIPRVVTTVKQDSKIADSDIELGAALLTDGGKRRGGVFRIRVSRQRKIDRLDNIGGWISRTVVPCAGDSAVSKSGRVITTKSDKIAYNFSYTRVPWISESKVVDSDTILSFSARQARLFVDSMVFFDGCITKTGVPKLYSSKPDVIAAFELAAIVAGYSVAPLVPRHSDISSMPNMSISLSDKNEVTISPYKDSRSSNPDKRKLSIERNGTDKVWCVTVPSHKIVVRRNGFSFVCGNCQALRDSFPTMCGGMYLREEAALQGELVDAPAREAKRPDFGRGMAAVDIGGNVSKPIIKRITEAPKPVEAVTTAPEASKVQTDAPGNAPEGKVTPSEGPSDAEVEASMGLAPETPENNTPQALQEAIAETQEAAGRIETQPDAQPDPKLAPRSGDSDSLASVKLLAAKSGVTSSQVIAWAIASKVAKPGQQLSDLSENKLMQIGQKWNLLLPKIKDQPR